MANATEVAYNLSLARLLRHEGLSAEGEQRRVFGGSRGQADVLLDFDEYAVVLEAEFGAPAKADADKRLPKDAPAIVNGLPVRLVVAIGYPEALADLPESKTDENLAACPDLRIAYRYFGEPWGEETTGSVADLAEVLRDYWIQSDNGTGIEETVSRADGAIKAASDVLTRIELQDRSEQDGPATKALIWLNALLFHELLALHLDPALLPEEHRGKRILRPDPDGGPSHLLQQWSEILDINWWPIFHIARETLKTTPSPTNQEAIRILKRAAAEIAETGTIRRHDVAGRIFHRLLDSRKFLATNYTTIPAAILLAGLAFDERSKCWDGVDFTDPKSVAGMRDEQALMRATLEDAVYGFDVVPAAIHLAASTLCMAESRQVIRDMNLWRVQHDVANGIPRLGSLDFLPDSPGRGNAAWLPVFTDGVSLRVTGEGEVPDDVTMPNHCHLVIANPPFTRAGGPGDEKNTLWNPMFGSILDAADSKKMNAALERTLKKTPASLYAGLGSAFVVLADENLSLGGRFAFVLPATVLTGSRWKSIRKMLREKYCIDWIIVSHDNRNRHSVQGLPGRRLVSFSESTRIAEVLIVATKSREFAASSNHVRFVNLVNNPDEPVQAMALTRKLLAMDGEASPFEPQAVAVGGTNWGSVTVIPQKELTDEPWEYTALAQPELVLVAEKIGVGGSGVLGTTGISELGDITHLGPYHMQVKNPKQGLFTIAETEDILRVGIPALWHHKATRNTTLESKADARLERRRDKDRAAQDTMLARQGRLHLVCDLGMAPQRVAAVLTESPMLAISSWITLVFKEPAHGKEEALCLWLNSTPGLLLRILNSNRPYLGRSRLPHELARVLPVLDVNTLSETQLEAAATLYGDLKTKELRGFTDIANDPVRAELNTRLCREVLDLDPSAVDALTRKLANEPTLHARA